jgi:hypothetical protein
MGLTLSAIPVYNDIADANLVGGQFFTDQSIQQISANAKFAAVRKEVIYLGFFWHGCIIAPPVSPVDGYQYLISECQFDWMIYSNRSPSGTFTPGQTTPPSQSNSQPQNGPYNFPGEWDINDLTGVVNLRTSYYSGGGAEVVNTDGIIKVYAMCQRGSVSQGN